METQGRLIVRELQPDEAAARLAGVERHDPRGVMTPDDVQAMCRRGLCFEARSPDGASAAVYVLHVKGGQVWVSAAAGAGCADLTHGLVQVIEDQAHLWDRVAFQTCRPGLVRKAMRHGYRARPFWVLEKELKQ